MPPMWHPGGPPTGSATMQGRLAGDCWDSLSSIGQGLEAPFRGPWHFHRHWFGHRGPAPGIPLQKKSRTSSTGGDAAASGPGRAFPAVPPFSPGSIAPSAPTDPGAQDPVIRQSQQPLLPGRDVADAIAAYVRRHHPQPGPPAGPPCPHPKVPPSTFLYRCGSH